MTMNLLLRMAAMLTLAVAGQAASHASGIYKWVDEKGITHYSQDPPPQGRFERFESERSASSPATKYCTASSAACMAEARLSNHSATAW